MLGRWFTRWWRAKPRRHRLFSRPRARVRLLSCELIEPRALLSTVTLAPSADNTIFEIPSGNSDGIGPDVYAGETERGFGARHALIKFDIAGNIPAGAHIDSVTLQLHVSKDLSSSVSLELHLLKADWGEGTSNAGEPGGQGTTATPNDATWIDRFVGASPAEKWATPGGDYITAASATANGATVINNQLFYKWSGSSGSQLAADVQNWLTSPGTQFGWLIKAANEPTLGTAQRLDSRETQTGIRPALTVTYTLPNLPPTIDPLGGPLNVLEGAATQTINLSNITAGAGESQSLMVTATSDQPSIIPTPIVNYANPSSTGTLQITPAADRFGSAKITVTVRDAGADGIFNNSDDATSSTTLTVNVTPVNDPPSLTFTPPADPILEDAPLQTINLSDISAGPFESQTITIIATSNNPGLIPNPTVNYTFPNTAGSLTYNPVANQSGQAVITIKVQDDGGTANEGVDTLIRTFTIHVTPVNDHPTLDAIANPLPILEDTPEHSIQLTGINAGPLEAGQLLTITATSSNPGLIANPTVTYNNGESTAILKYTPQPNQAGIATITVKVKDDGGTANTGADAITQTFAINVTPVNDAPEIDLINNPAAILENSGQQTIQLSGISAGPSETQVISITAESDNPTLIPNPGVNYTSPFIGGFLTYTPSAHRSGVAHIKVTVQDNGGTANSGIDTTTRTFTVAVTDINDPPTLDAISDPQGIAANSLEQTVSLTGISAGPLESQPIQISASSNNPTLIPSVAVTYTSPNDKGSVAYTPAANQTGNAVILVTVRDAGPDGVFNNDDDATTERTFTVRVLSPDEVNHAPSFVAGTIPAAPPVTDETGPVSVKSFATQISPGPPQESDQKVSFRLDLSTDDQKLFAVLPQVNIDTDGTGTLTFTPAPNAHGTAHISIQAQDDGGTAIGGVDTSPLQFFDITITKPHVWHNTRNGRDVDDDHFVVAQDVITIINRINAKGSGKIPDDATFGPPYYDVDNDGNVVAEDVLNIINFINAGHGGAGEAPPVDPAAADAVFQSIGDNLLALTLSDAVDSTSQLRRK